MDGTKGKAADKQRDNSGKKASGRPFAKGESGNPRGRPAKGRAMADLLNAELDESGGRRKVVRALVNAAAEGDMQAVKIIFDRIDGKAPETVNMKAEIADGGETRAMIEAALAKRKQNP